jgi:hypothetical protein
VELAACVPTGQTRFLCCRHSSLFVCFQKRLVFISRVRSVELKMCVALTWANKYVNFILLYFFIKWRAISWHGRTVRIYVWTCGRGQFEIHIVSILAFKYCSRLVRWFWDRSMHYFNSSDFIIVKSSTLNIRVNLSTSLVTFPDQCLLTPSSGRSLLNIREYGHLNPSIVLIIY